MTIEIVTGIFFNFGERTSVAVGPTTLPQVARVRLYSGSCGGTVQILDGDSVAVHLPPSDIRARREMENGVLALGRRVDLTGQGINEAHIVVTGNTRMRWKEDKS